MTRKNNKTIFRVAVTLSILAVLLVVAFATYAKRFGIQATQPTGTALQAKTPTTEVKNKNDTRYTIPTRLVIPKINVDTTILQMGLTASGDMEAPVDVDDSGWYKYGPRPGNVGSAVIAAHFGTKKPGVFRQLDVLVKGDTISVTDDRRQTATFIVTGTRRYSNNDAPSEVFTSSSGAHLNLITCNGSWDATKKTYSQRLVVFADKVQ